MNFTLTAPVRSIFVDCVSEYIDDKLTTDDRIATLGSSMFAEPLTPKETSGENLSDHEILLYETLLKNLHRLPADPQSEILKSTRGFQSWVVTKMHCKDEAIDLYAKSVLNDLDINYYFGNPTEILLRHVFQQLTLNSNAEEVDNILGVYRDEAEAVESTKNKMQIIAEKVISVSATVLIILAVPAAIGIGYLIYSKGHEIIEYAKINYLPILINKVINNIPSQMIRIATIIYEWKIVIALSAFVLSFTPLNDYAFIRIPVNIVKEIVYLPITILGIPFKVGFHVFWKVLETTQKTYQFMKEGSNLLESVRRAQELQHAETLWVNQIMGLKVSAAAA